MLGLLASHPFFRLFKPLVYSLEVDEDSYDRCDWQHHETQETGGHDR